MSLYPNPFSSRASEHQRDMHQFVSTFGAGAIDLLPAEVWDRLVVLRSSPGAGKTSLMRIFTTEALCWVRDRQEPSDPLRRELTDRGALDQSGQVKKIGVLVSLDRDYKSLVDLPVDQAAQHRLFLRLLDCRLVTGVIRAALVARSLRYPADASQFRFDDQSAEAKTQEALLRIGGPNGEDLLEYCRETERKTIELLDAVLVSQLDTSLDGHSELYLLSILEECKVRVADEELELQPLLMLDDGQELEASQREVLIENLRKRRSRVARWYAERFEALSDQELLQGLGSDGRDHIPIDIDSIARNGLGRQFSASAHNKILSFIARQRAAPALTTYAQESQPLFELLEETPSAEESGDIAKAIDTLRSRAISLADGDERYSHWIASCETKNGLAAAVGWKEIEVLIARDQNRQQDLFEEALKPEEIGVRSSSALREGAEVSLAQEFGLSYYWGEQGLLSLGSHNAEQFLNLCGALFDDLLIDVSLGRKPRLSAKRQHKLLKLESDRYWASIARTVPHGRDVRTLISEIVKISVAENKKPTMPYPPGVTGTALKMSDRDRLLDSAYRSKAEGSERLFRALASAVAYNVITADLDYSVKGDRYMVLYLNRLLCPKFGLPLGRGAFKERSLRVMQGWFSSDMEARSVEAESDLRLQL